ncbi:MAG: hypothetical protein AB1898_21470 [Acidobacteriota bacterium]
MMLILVLTGRNGAGKAPFNNSPEPLFLKVLVFHYAPACSIRTRDAAQEIAGRIFHRAGIAVRWVNCSLSKEGSFASAECMPPLEPSAIVLRLVPTSPATQDRFGRQTLGVAAQPQSGTPASASVLYDRAERVAKDWLAPIEVVLGQAMAHEMGHLLLGAGAHSASGLMKAYPNQKDLAGAAGGNLLFSASEIEIIRTRLSRRDP